MKVIRNISRIFLSVSFRVSIQKRDSKNQGIFRAEMEEDDMDFMVSGEIQWNVTSSMAPSHSSENENNFTLANQFLMAFNQSILEFCCNILYLYIIVSFDCISPI